MWPSYGEFAQILTAVGAMIGAIAALGALILGLRNSAKITDVHIAINSRMDQLLNATGLAERARGANEERDRKREQT